MEARPQLLITGVSGFLGSWVCKKALESGEYRVRGTVRDANDEEVKKLLKEAFEDDYSHLELVSADLTNRASIFEAVEGCDQVIHTCSPFPAESPKDGENEVVKPAVDGVKYILNACEEFQVKKLVVTSSALTITDQAKGPGDVDESSFTELNARMAPYYVSKIQSEKFALDYVEALPEEARTFDLVILNPGFIVGPTLMSRARGVSCQAILDVLNNTMKADAPQFYVPHIDVRDAAEAHISALSKGKHGERYCLSSGTYKIVDFCTAISEEFTPRGYEINTKELCYSLVWIASFFNTDANNLTWIWNVRVNAKGDKAKRELGIRYIDMKTSVVDMCESFIEKGLAEDKLKK